MRIYLTSVLVDDQEKALRFYTDVLGFMKKNRHPLGEHALAHRRRPPTPPGAGAGCWSPTPTRPPSRTRRRWWPTGSRPPPSPSTTCSAEFQRLRGLGVRFTQEPLEMGGVTTAVFDDTCGNLIQIAATN